MEPRGCVKDWLEGKPTPGVPQTSSHLAQSRHWHPELGMNKLLHRSKKKGVICDCTKLKHHINNPMTSPTTERSKIM